MKLTFVHGSLSLPTAGQIVVNAGQLEIKSRYVTGRTILTLPASGTIVAIEDGPADEAIKILREVVNATRIDGAGYSASQQLKKLKAELKDFNAATGCWKKA